MSDSHRLRRQLLRGDISCTLVLCSSTCRALHYGHVFVTKVCQVGEDNKDHQVGGTSLRVSACSTSFSATCVYESISWNLQHVSVHAWCTAVELDPGLGYRYGRRGCCGGLSRYTTTTELHYNQHAHLCTASTLPTIPSLSNTPRHSDSPLASLVRTLATLKRAISKRASTNGNGNCRDKSHPIHSVRPSVLIPKNGDEIRITVETVRDPPRTPIGHVPVQTHVDQDQEHRDDQEEKDDSEQEDGASVRWYKLVEVPPTRTPSRAGIDVEAADVRIRASKALRIRSSPPPRPASTDGIARAGGRRTLHLQDPHLAGRGTATSPPSRSGSPTVHHHPHLPSPLNTHHHPHSHSRSASANLPTTTTPRGRADDLFRSHSLRRTVSSRYGITGVTSGLVSRSSSTRSRTPDEVGDMFGTDDEADMAPIRGVSPLPAPKPTLAPLGASGMIRSTTLKLPIVSPSPARAYPSPMITPRRGPPAPLPLDLPLVPSNSDSDSRTPGVQTPCAWTPGGHVQLPPSRRPSIKRDQRDKDKTLPQTPVLKDGDKTWI
jgi:hypothetical protein